MILTRYLTKEVFKSQIAILFILLLIFFSQQLVRVLGSAANGKVPADLAALLREHLSIINRQTEPEADLDALQALADDGSLAALVIPGGDHCEAGHERLIEVVGNLVDQEVPVAAICGATLLLARGGFLDERRHTSNAASYLGASGYRGGVHYVETPVVTDRGVTTASGIHAVPFTAEVMRITGLVPDAMVDSWEQVFLNGKEKDYMTLMEATVAWQNA